MKREIRLETTDADGDAVPEKISIVFLQDNEPIGGATALINPDGTIKEVAAPLIEENAKTKATLAKSPIGMFNSNSSLFNISAMTGKETKLAFSELGA